MITCAMPIFNNAKIAWLQLEALCNQKKAGEWELIIAEDPSEDYCGQDFIKPFIPRLKKAGCVRIAYLSLSEWVALGQKWLILRSEMSVKSIGFILVSSDDYSASDRLVKTREAIESGADWVHSTQCHFLNLQSKKGAIFNCATMGVFQALSRSAIMSISEREHYPKKGVDTWLFTNSNPKNIINIESSGVCTDGANSISKDRHLLYQNESIGDFTVIEGESVLRLFPKKIKDKLSKWQ
jgi:hypothetical protein